MNKADLIHALKEQAGIPKKEATTVVEAFFGEMANALSRCDRIELRGLFTFCVKSYKPYTGRNPKTGKPVEIKPKKLPFFKCGAELRQRLNS